MKLQSMTSAINTSASDSHVVFRPRANKSVPLGIRELGGSCVTFGYKLSVIVSVGLRPFAPGKFAVPDSM